MSGWTETISDPDMRLGEILNGLTIPVFSVGVGWKMTFFPESTFYDPAAVLEAIREAGVAPSVFSYQSGWIAQMYAERPVKSLGSVITSDSGSPFPDFASAVRWLHAQAAAADPEFAAKWPVPE